MPQSRPVTGSPKQGSNRGQRWIPAVLKKIQVISQLEEERDRRAEEVTALDSACTILALRPTSRSSPSRFAGRGSSYRQSCSVSGVCNSKCGSNINTNVHCRKSKRRSYNTNARRVRWSLLSCTRWGSRTVQGTSGGLLWRNLHWQPRTQVSPSLTLPYNGHLILVYMNYRK